MSEKRDSELVLIGTGRYRNYTTTEIGENGEERVVEHIDIIDFTPVEANGDSEVLQ